MLEPTGRKLCILLEEYGSWFLGMSRGQPVVQDMLYYAYGSLVNRDKLLELCPAAVPVSPAKITDHALCFTGHSQVWGGGTATIGQAPGSDLWGGLYEIDAAGRAEIERSGKPDGYVWALTSVENAVGERVRAGLLVKVRDFERVEPSAAYLEVLTSGWVQWGLDPNEILQDVAPTI